MEALTAYEFFESIPASGGEVRARQRFRRELDYAYFAARLGWTPEEYGSLTPVQRLFVRKELETVMAERVNLLQDIVAVGMSNAWAGKNRRIFKRRIGRDETITQEQVDALAKACRENPPWSPWR